MEKVRFGYRNRIDAATLSGGSWQAPLTNIQTLRLAQRARSTTTNPNDCLINIEFDEDRLIQVMSVNAHNISANGYVRIFAGSAPGLNDLYDSGEVEVWPTMYSTLSLHWTDYHFWSGKIDEEVRKEYQKNFIHICTASVKTKYWGIQVYDTGNADGYVEIGRLFMGRLFTPQFNVIYGAQIAWEDNSKIESSLVGVEYMSKVPMTRVAQVNYDYSFRREALEGLYELQRQSGTTQEVLFIGNADDSNQMVRLSFLGRFRRIEPLKWHFMDIHSTGFEVKELL